MSRLNEVTWWLAVLLGTFLLVVFAMYAASCTIQVGQPQISVGCIVVDVGSSQVQECPDAGRDAK